MMRYNTFDERVEIYDGVSFVGVAGPSAGVNVQEAEDIGILQAQCLDKENKWQHFLETQ